jgi:hypothetical protein
MPFEEGDTVVLQDKHSEHDGESGEITQVSETMFGDETYTVSFADGQVAGISAGSLEPADESTDADTDEE